MKIKKACNFRSIFIIFTIFLFSTVVYASIVSEDALRLPVGTQDDTLERIKALLELQKVFAFLAEQNELPVSSDPADLLIIFGNDDIRTIERAAQVYNDGLANNVAACGGTKGRLHKDLVKHIRETKYNISGDLNLLSEAEIIKQVLVVNGVPEDKIILEERSAHTRQNVDELKAVLHKRGVQKFTAILIQKPLQQMRARLTFEKGFEEEIEAGDVRYISYAAYLPYITEMSREELAKSIVLCKEEFGKFEEYGPRGKDHMKEVRVPDEIRDAYTYFFERGISLTFSESDIRTLKEIVDRQRQVQEATEDQL